MNDDRMTAPAFWRGFNETLRDMRLARRAALLTARERQQKDNGK